VPKQGALGSKQGTFPRCRALNHVTGATPLIRVACSANSRKTKPPLHLHTGFRKRLPQNGFSFDQKLEIVFVCSLNYRPALSRHTAAPRYRPALSPRYRPIALQPSANRLDIAPLSSRYRPAIAPLSPRCRPAVAPLSTLCRSVVAPLSPLCRPSVAPLSPHNYHAIATLATLLPRCALRRKVKLKGRKIQ